MSSCEIARLKITKESLPLKFQNEIVENADKVTIRTNIKSMTELNEWVKEFGVRTNTKWIIKRSCRSGEKFVCLKSFLCHHSSFHKVPASQNKKGKSKNTGCLASILVKIKLNTWKTRKKDMYLKKGLAGVITVSPFHNHSLKPAETINFLPAEEFKIKEEDSSNGDLGNVSFNGKSSFSLESLHNTTNQSSENSIQADNRCWKSERLLGKIKFEDSFKDDLGNVSLDRTASCSSESHLITSNHSPENSIPSNNKYQKKELSETLLDKIKCEDSSNDGLGNVSLDSTSQYNSESLHVTANHSSENNIQAHNKSRKKELSERLLDLLGNGLEKFEASETALELAVNQLKKISTEEDWETMVATLGNVPSVKEREAAIMAQYIPIAPKPVGVTKCYRPIGVTKGNKQYTCSTPSIETKGSTQFTLGHPPIESQIIIIAKNNT